MKFRPASVAALIALPITMPATATRLRTSASTRRSPKITTSAAQAPDSTPATAIRRPCQSPWIRRPEVHDAVVSISTTKAATVHGTARIPRSSRAITLSWTAARTTTTIGNQPSPILAHRPRPTVRPVIASRPAPNPAYDAIPCTASSSPTRPTLNRVTASRRALAALTGCRPPRARGLRRRRPPRPLPVLARVLAARRPRVREPSCGTRRTAGDGGTSSARRPTSSTRTRPAVWSSADAAHWEVVRLDPGRRLLRRPRDPRLGGLQPRSGRGARREAGRRPRDAAHGDLAGAQRRVAGGGPGFLRAVRRGEGRPGEPAERRPATAG